MLTAYTRAGPGSATVIADTASWQLIATAWPPPPPPETQHPSLTYEVSAQEATAGGLLQTEGQPGLQTPSLEQS